MPIPFPTRLRLPPYTYSPIKIRLKLTIQASRLNAVTLKPLTRPPDRQSIAAIIVARLVATRPQRRMLLTAGDSRAAGRGRCADEEEDSWYRVAAGAVVRGRTALLLPLAVFALDAGVRGVGGGATFLRIVTVRVLILGLLGSNMAGP